MTKATGIDHIAIDFSDIKAAKEFFIEALGLKLYKDYGDEIFLNVGRQKLALFQGKNKTRTLNHVAFKVDNYKAVKKRLKKLGYKIYDNDLIDGPGGITVQLVR